MQQLGFLERMVHETDFFTLCETNTNIYNLITL
jgi:hypothetical protein